MSTSMQEKYGYCGNLLSVRGRVYHTIKLGLRSSEQKENDFRLLSRNLLTGRLFSALNPNTKRTQSGSLMASVSQGLARGSDDN
ncbi:hypothetical protein PM082_024193 [Marasmius tenuissimus]|nr:hypothetical protein PM082_024193 [Marasmius tenuissimus]